MKKQYSGAYVLLITIISCVATAAICLGITLYSFGGVQSFSAAMKFLSVRGVIENRYIGDADMEFVDDTAYRAMVAATEDRWSYYMNAREYEQYKDYSKNQYAGIGVTIQADEESGGLYVNSVTKDSPASIGGIKAGMIMMAIDGESLIGMSTAEVRGIIQLSFGKTIAITVLDTDGETKDISVACEMVYTNPVSYEMLPENIAYIKIKNFETGVSEDFEKALTELMTQGAESLIVDVRGNPGGKVNQLMPILDSLLPEGDIFVSRDKSGKEKVTVSDENCIEIPMAVLVNGDSYSAAEFFAAALREYDWATVVGENTTGKGRSQVTLELSDGSAVHISTNVYLTPKRVDLSEQGGLEPDVVVELDEEKRMLLDSGELSPQDDDQILAAIDLLK